MLKFSVNVSFGLVVAMAVLLAYDYSHGQNSQGYFSRCDFTSNRLDAFRNADLELAESFLHDDADRIAGEMLPIGQVTGMASAARESVIQTRYRWLVARYAIVRMKKIGACSEPTSRLVETVTVRQTYGGFRVREDTREVTTFTVPRKFRNIVTKGLETSRMDQSVFDSLTAFFNEHGCASEIRQRIEDNMLKFVQGRCFDCIDGRARNLQRTCYEVGSEGYHQKKVEDRLDSWSTILD